jgi:nucleoside-triphosphatase THEP1
LTAIDSSNVIFQTAVSFVNHTDRHLFLTGKAGTGKTTFLKHIRQHSSKKTAIVAPTGVAAINAGGVTIHSLLQIPPGVYVPSHAGTSGKFGGTVYDRHMLLKQMRMSADKKDLLRELDLLIIDEVSMVRADLLDAVDAVLRHVRKRPSIPFGGVQMLYIGDLFQLPPVAVLKEWELLKNYYSSPFFFNAHVLQSTPPIYIELKKIYRQQDELFISILNNVRNNCCTDTDLNRLHVHYDPTFLPPDKEKFIVLTTHNEKAAAINNAELRKLPDKLHQFKAETTGDFWAYPADEALSLKKGAQVMFIKNDSGESRRYYNGKIGTVHSVDENEIQVTFPGETTILTLEKETWKNITYHYHKEKDKIEEEELGTFTQYPVRLAWAITIHKSQGLTFEKAIIDAGASFAAGQVYVALSRLTSLDGLVLKSRISRECIQTDDRIVEFASTELSDDRLNEILEKEQRKYIHHSITKAFSWEKIIEILMEHINEYEHRNLPDAEACVLWAEELTERARTISNTASKFQLQLEQLFQLAETSNYHHCFERIIAACTFFIRETHVRLLTSLEEHIEKMKIKKRTRRYVKQLVELTYRVERKKLELQNLMSVATSMRDSGNGLDISAAVNALHKPTVIDTKLHDAKTSRTKVVKGETQRISLQLFRKGKSIEEIASARSLASSTIEGHLASFVSTGEIDVLELVDKFKLDKISQLVNKNPAITASGLKQQLGEGFSYGQIKAVMNHYVLASPTSGGRSNLLD